jgi:hypothetical protein
MKDTCSGNTLMKAILSLAIAKLVNFVTTLVENLDKTSEFNKSSAESNSHLNIGKWQCAT